MSVRRILIVRVMQFARTADVLSLVLLNIEKTYSYHLKYPYSLSSIGLGSGLNEFCLTSPSQIRGATCAPGLRCDVNTGRCANS